MPSDNTSDSLHRSFLDPTIQLGLQAFSSRLKLATLDRILWKTSGPSKDPSRSSNNHHAAAMAEPSTQPHLTPQFCFSTSTFRGKLHQDPAACHAPQGN